MESLYKNDRNDVCGAYSISEGYFLTSQVTSRSQLYKSYTYQACATNPTCATLAVKLFLQRVPTDCDGDGDIDCDDFVSEHYYGPEACVGAGWIKFSDTWRKYRDCKREYGLV
ncbi:uncharacterized protein LOC119111232 [Pollicipes pollicipes]|uniref:uncharacterized protein LOC119111232 n=1 Tax=Pollicipes pollicipes TaxID=41117 RepID=UPI001885126D|nr:uncharacterized protein LOC119111232 [Pollicipes pollicipes]